MGFKERTGIYKEAGINASMTIISQTIPILPPLSDTIHMTTNSRGRSQFKDNRIFRFLSDYPWFILIFLAIVTVGISYYGLLLSFQENRIPYTSLDLIYISLQLFVLESGSIPPVTNIWIQIGRFLAPAIAAATFLLILILIFIDYLKSFRLSFLTRRHIIVCGLGYLGPVIVKYYRDQGKKVVIIESDSENKDLARCKEQGVLTITGDATKTDSLKKAKITKAERMFLVTGSDAVNAEIAVKAYDLLQDQPRSSPFTCHAHIVDQTLCTVLRNHQMQEYDNPDFRWEFFNLYQIGGYCIQKAFPPGGTDILPEDLKILVIGVGRMGETLIVQLAKRWKEQYGSLNKRFSVTIIDKNAEDILGLIMLRHPGLQNYCSITPIPCSIPSPEFSRGSFLFDENGKTFHQIYICIGDSSVGLSAALQIQTAYKGVRVPIIVRTTYLEGTTRLFQIFQEGSPLYSNIFAFPLVSCKCCHDLLIEGLVGLFARIIHDDYRTKRIEEGKNPDEDPALAPWTTLDETYRRANLDQAGHIFTKIMTIQGRVVPLHDWDEPLFTFTKEEIEKLAALEHERWNQDRIADGWTYGKERDKVKKITPYLVPYDQLTEDIKEYDRDTVRNIPLLLAKINLTVRRDFESHEENHTKFTQYQKVCGGD